MGGWTGRGKDRIIWDGIISINGEPVEQKDLTTKKYVDDNVGSFDANIIVVLDGAVATLDGNVLILE